MQISRRDKVLSCRYLKENGHFCADISKLVSCMVQISQNNGYFYAGISERKWVSQRVDTFES